MRVSCIDPLRTRDGCYKRIVHANQNRYLVGNWGESLAARQVKQSDRLADDLAREFSVDQLLNPGAEPRQLPGLQR